MHRVASFRLLGHRWVPAALFLALYPAGPAGTVELVRGDADGSGSLTVTDAIRIVQFLFLGNPAAVQCADAADTDDSGALELTDAIALLNYLFGRGSTPPAPFPDCGDDPTADALGCEVADGCRFSFQIYGKELIADGIFFVVDSSGSMQDSGELQIAKREMIRVITELKPETQFGVVFFNRSVSKFPASGQAAEANDAMKTAAASYIQSVSAGSGSCMQAGLGAAVNFAYSSAAPRAAILYIGDGGGTCSGQDESIYLAETLATITQANAGRARIHTFGVLQIPLLNEKFLKDLAEQNGGTYTSVVR